MKYPVYNMFIVIKMEKNFVKMIQLLIYTKCMLIQEI